jgi:nuclear pore complex protein Nup85
MNEFTDSRCPKMTPSTGQWYPHLTKVKQCLMRGHFDIVLNLLKRVESFKACLAAPSSGSMINNPLKKLEELMNSMPVHDPLRGGSVNEFMNAWNEFNSHANFIYADGELSSLKFDSTISKDEFRDLFGILAGDKRVIMASSSNWKEILVARLRFCNPSLKAGQLASLVLNIKQHFNSNILLDQIQLAIFDQDMYLLLQYCSQYDWWLVTHLVDLLESANLLGDIQESFAGKDDGNEKLENCTLSQWFKLVYADWIFSEPSLWRVCLEYLLHCGPSGLAMLEHVIGHIPLNSETKNRKLITFCGSHSLHSVKTTILCTLGKRALDSKRFGEAILHYMDAKKHGIISLIVKELIDAYLNEGDDTYENVADNLSSSALYSSPSLNFLLRFREFKKKQVSDIKECGHLLTLLLTSDTAPKEYWPMLLADSIPILENEQFILGYEETIELMRCTQEVIARYDANIETKCAEMTEKLMNVKLALSRNLARAMILK